MTCWSKGLLVSICAVLAAVACTTHPGAWTHGWSVYGGNQAAQRYAGTATPATYMVEGKQYVVIGTNNARDRKAPQGAAYVAFALP